jgi:3-oxoadipate enol-lactonase
MALLDVAGTGLFYRLDGAEGAPALVLSNSLGTTHGLWEPQMAALQGRFRVLRHDTRGHGGSGVSAGPYTIEGLGRDVLALMDGLGIERASFCGISMGGMIGMWLGINAPERLERLALCNTSARIGGPEAWNERIATVHERGMEAVLPAVIERWFTGRFRERSPAAVERIAAMLRSTPVEGYAACSAAVRNMDLLEQVERIRAPTLVVAGTHDTSTPPAHAAAIAERVKGSRLVELDAAHLSNVEQVEAFSAALLDFLTC